MTIPTPAPYLLTRPLRCPPGVRVEGQSGRAVKRLDGSGQCALELVGGKGEGVVQDVRFEEGRTPGAASRAHHVLVTGGAWVLDGLDVRDAVHDGIAIQGGDVWISDLRGDGCGRGEVVIVGGESVVAIERAAVHWIHHEIETAGDATLIVLDSECDHLGLGVSGGAPLDLFDLFVGLERVRVAETFSCASSDLVAVDCDFSLCRSWWILQPGGHSRLERCRLPGSAVLRGQSSSRPALGQRLELVDCEGPGLLVTGEVDLTVTGGTIPITVDSRWGRGVVVNGEQLAPGATWRPS